MQGERDLVRVEDLTKTFVSTSLFGRRTRVVHAVSGVSFQVRQGQTLCLAGESGSGKTTIARMIAALDRPTGGSILVDGTELGILGGRLSRAHCRTVQMVFQDPYESLNPRLTIAEILQEPVRVHKLARTDQATHELITRTLTKVNLEPAQTYLDRFPHQLSGGERQRVLIASCLLPKPRLLIADEPVSMLDVSIKAGIIRLLQDIKISEKLTLLLITHDLSVARYLADRIVILYRGSIIEEAPAEDLLAKPCHPYTKALLAAIPRIALDGSRKRHVAKEPDKADRDHPGCRFLDRCPYRQKGCEPAPPKLVEIEPGHAAACYLLPPRESGAAVGKGGVRGP
jgi:peptide/nickel transport system ATP-binding protein